MQGSEDCFPIYCVHIHHCPPCPAVSVAQTAKVRLLVYRYCECSPPSIYGHRHGSAFALRILGMF